MGQLKVITALGGRKFIVAETVLGMAFVASLLDKMNPMLASILAGVAMGYGAFNAASKFADKRTEK